MLWLLLLCFAVGLVVVALFSRQGRGCLVGAAGIALGIVAITALGAAILIGLALMLFG
jgi:hypothetical protein